VARGRYDEKLAAEFAAKLARTGLRPSEFARQAGFSRGAMYHLSRGQAPSSEAQAKKLAEAFERLKKE